jgi:hypothetical protein
MGKESRLTGTGGTYYVMSQLAIRGFHASCTFGNAPFVDVLVASPDGHETLSIQVKTAFEARRYDRKKELKELQWTLGWKSAKQCHAKLFLAFVDLKSISSAEMPDVYIIPSAWIRDYCAEWVDKVKWVRFHVDPTKIGRFKNNWEQISKALK